MKNLFNNPWFIGALGVFAMAYLGITVIKPLFQNDSTFTDTAEFGFLPTPGDVAAAVFEGSTGSLSSSRADIGWLNDLSRDPFSKSLAKVGDEALILPRVEALFVGAGVQAAVVNNRLVRIGDLVDQFLITDISAEHILVQRAGQSYRLEPDV